jgi:hypothetical protein
MTKREKIIVGVMCLTIVYGAYELIGSGARGPQKSAPAPSNTPKVSATDEMRKFATEMTQKLVAERMGTEARKTLDQASSEWTKDPFIQSTAPIDSKSTEPTAPKQSTGKAEIAPAFSLTGFLQMGNTQLAIINGMEYAVGDTIDAGGHYLESISPEGVVIGAANGEKIQLTLSEID